MLMLPFLFCFWRIFLKYSIAEGSIANMFIHFFLTNGCCYVVFGVCPKTQKVVDFGFGIVESYLF